MQEVKSKKILVVVALVATIAIIDFCYKSCGYSSLGSDKTGLDMFYTLNSCGLFVPFYLFVAFLSNNFIIDFFYKSYQTKFQNFIITRESNKKRVLKEIKLVLISSFLLRLILHIIVLFVIHFFYVKIHLVHTGDVSYFPNTFFALSQNSVVSFFLYLLYSSIGFSIFSLFLYSLMGFIKNRYVYKVTGILLSIALVMLPALMGNIFLFEFDHKSYFETGFIYILYSAGLLSPGLEVLKVNSYYLANNIYFAITSISYIVVSIILIIVNFKRRKTYG